MARPTAFMPLWIGDYLADTTHLTPEQHGAYLLLLMAYWRRGGPLPADDAYLCRIAGMTPYKWRGVRPTIVAFFDERAGFLVSKRSDEELAKAEVKYGKRAAAGRKGGSAPKISGRKITYAPALAASSASTTATIEADNAKTADMSRSGTSNASPELEARLKQSQSQSEKEAAATTISLIPEPPKPAPVVVPIRPQGEKSPREVMFDRLGTALEIPFERMVRYPAFEKFPSVMADWIEQGCDPEKDIWPTITKLAKRANVRSDLIRSPNYFEDAIYSARDTRLASLPTPSEMREKIDGAVGAFKLQGWWHDDFGPKPFEPGCNVPADILAKHFPQNTAAMH